MEKMPSRPTLSLEEEVVGVKSIISIHDYSFSDNEDSEVQFLKTTSNMPAYQQEQDVVLVKQVKRGNATHSAYYTYHDGSGGQ
mmetsp:Transcript_3576/g.6530  ORF Transcript_3576/g.6530 Transcript_3576/m.6530 type:complete len:83 (+) Transcript_3576:54-302(+)